MVGTIFTERTRAATINDAWADNVRIDISFLACFQNSIKFQMLNKSWQEWVHTDFVTHGTSTFPCNMSGVMALISSSEPSWNKMASEISLSFTKRR